MTIKLDTSWLKELEEEFNKEYMNSLRAFLVEEKNKGKETQKLLSEGGMVVENKGLLLTQLLK